MVGISKKLEVALDMFILPSEPENQGTVTPMCTVCRPKIFWQINPLPKGVKWCKSQENRRF